MLRIVPIPALSDNYIWIIAEGQQAVIVDPAEAGKVIAFLTKHHLTPKAILLTHNHRDHTDGVEELYRYYTDLVVYGPVETVQFNHYTLWDNDGLTLLGHSFQVLKSAGHTAEHISYLMDNAHLFCGDALFSAGCGRVFTGDYLAQFEALRRFNALPDAVKIYAGHEYTLANLAFAETVLPPNCELFDHIELAHIRREQQQPTLPSTIGIERHINPFLRAETLDDFIRLRKLKDAF